MAAILIEVSWTEYIDFLNHLEMDIFLGSTILGKLFTLKRRNQGGYEKEEGWHKKILKEK